MQHRSSGVAAAHEADTVVPGGVVPGGGPAAVVGAGDDITAGCGVDGVPAGGDDCAVENFGGGGGGVVSAGGGRVDLIDGGAVV